MATVHKFESTGDAYDQSQCRDDIKDGDVLVVRNTVAILCGAWPVTVKGEPGEFHTLEEGVSWNTYEDGKYLGVARMAADIDTFPTPLEAITDAIKDRHEALQRTLDELQSQIQWCRDHRKPDLQRSLEAAEKHTLALWGTVHDLSTTLKDAKYKWDAHEYAKEHGIRDEDVADHRIDAILRS